MKKMRVPLPEHYSEEWIKLAKKMLLKHEADGATSILGILDWASIKMTIEKSEAFYREAEILRAQSAQRTIDRDYMMDELKTNVRSVRDMLTAYHIKNMKNIADWGFHVVEAPAARRTMSLEEDLPSVQRETAT